MKHQDWGWVRVCAGFVLAVAVSGACLTVAAVLVLSDGRPFSLSRNGAGCGGLFLVIAAGVALFGSLPFFAALGASRHYGWISYRYFAISGALSGLASAILFMAAVDLSERIQHNWFLFSPFAWIVMSLASAAAVPGALAYRWLAGPGPNRADPAPNLHRKGAEG